MKFWGSDPYVGAVGRVPASSVDVCEIGAGADEARYPSGNTNMPINLVPDVLPFTSPHRLERQ